MCKETFQVFKNCANKLGNRRKKHDTELKKEVASLKDNTVG
jgi:hypothetical protein